jgi:hypothetical protein
VACAAVRREGAVARGWRARSLVACAAVRREGAVACKPAPPSDGRARLLVVEGRGRSWPAPPSDGRALSLVACAAVRREGAVARGLRRVGARWPDAGCAEFFTMRLWLHSLVALLPGYHYNHNIYISAFIPSDHDSGLSVDGP